MQYATEYVTYTDFEKTMTRGRVVAKRFNVQSGLNETRVEFKRVGKTPVQHWIPNYLLTDESTDPELAPARSDS